MDKEVERLINVAFDEDFQKLGDITTLALIDELAQGQGSFISKSEGILSGMNVAKRCFNLYDRSIIFNEKKHGGDYVKENEVIAVVKGKVRSLLSVERVALNFLTHLSGIATATKSFSEEIKETGCKLRDTRKTTPGLRRLEKQAVKYGGGRNHRMGLYDGILVKDNHLKFQGIKQSVSSLRAKYPRNEIEVEVETIEQVKEAIDAGADMLLLDNMDLEMIKEAVKLCENKVKTEASGGILKENVRKVALAGVDYVSTSAITMAASSLDMSFELISVE
ncbi:MAG: carboxylating nicotinate-nucleotide diphosphorylase [Actinobacteria bacterium]|nr:MAG: carboxylating nicotinate-nucleotide diphosphorylase [Actinomycetota bacterium]